MTTAASPQPQPQPQPPASIQPEELCPCCISRDPTKVFKENHLLGAGSAINLHCLKYEVDFTCLPETTTANDNGQTLAGEQGGQASGGGVETFQVEPPAWALDFYDSEVEGLKAIRGLGFC